MPKSTLTETMLGNPLIIGESDTTYPDFAKSDAAYPVFAESYV